VHSNGPVQGLLLKGEDMEALENVRIPTCSNFLKFVIYWNLVSIAQNNQHKISDTNINVWQGCSPLKFTTYTAINHPFVSLVWSYYIIILYDIDLKSEILDKCHKTDPYYYQIYYF
jgi:hypothetical protein